MGEKGFAKFLVDKWIEHGGSLVDEKTAAKRRAICDACPKKGTVHPVPGEKYEGCLVCRCIISSKVKAEYIYNFKKLRTELNKCPERKW